MKNYKLIIQYDGTRYKGWQRLGNTENTIQEKIEKVLTEFVGAPVEIMGRSRTVGGVHALHHVANVKLKNDPSPSEVKEYLNRYLPEDIGVIEVEEVQERFHARFNARYKTYLYKIWNRKHPNPFMRKYSMHIPEDLNVEAMKKASRHFIGTHDFTAFSNVRSKTKSFVRTVEAVTVEEKDGFIDIRITGDGFLHNMVRKIVGCLVQTGKGLLPEEEIPSIIESKDRSRVLFMAEAKGLFLESVVFDSPKD
jgi:tRNA pseudouridine38-40 synthase